MGAIGAGERYVVKAVPERWVAGPAWRTGVFLTHKNGGPPIEHLGWVESAGWKLGQDGTCELELDNGTVLRLQRVARMPLPLPPPEADEPEVLVDGEAVDGRTVEQIARDYLRQIETFVGDEEVTRDEQPHKRPRRPPAPASKRERTDVQWRLP